MQGDPDVASFWEEPDLQLLWQLAVGSGVGKNPSDSHDTLDSLFVFQYGLSEANSERLRSLHIHTKDGHSQAPFHCYTQDFFLSPGGYFLLKRPESKFLEDEAVAANFVRRQKKHLLVRGWRSVLEFSAHLPLPPSVCPLLSPSKNSLLRMVPSLCHDLSFVEAVVKKAQQEGIACISPIDSQTGSPPACGTPQVPPTPTSSPTIRRSSRDPSFDLPVTEVEPFSLGASAAFLLPSLSETAWGSPPEQKSRGRFGASLPALFESIGIEASGWEQCPSLASETVPPPEDFSAPAISPASSLAPSTPQIGACHFPGFSAPPHTESFSTVQQCTNPRGLRSPPTSVGEVYPNLSKSLMARTHRGSAGIAVPSAYHALNPQTLSRIARPTLSLPRTPSPTHNPSFSAPLASGPPQLAVWSPFSNTLPKWGGGLESAGTRVVRQEPNPWPSPEVAALLARWSADQKLPSSVQAAEQSLDKESHHGRGGHLASIPSLVSQPNPASNLPFLDVFAQLVSSLTPEQTHQVMQNLANSVATGTGEPHPAQGNANSSQQTFPGLAYPTKFLGPDPIGTAFAVLDQGLAHSWTSTGPHDVSPTSSSSSFASLAGVSGPVVSSVISFSPANQEGPAGTGPLAKGPVNDAVFNKTERLRQLSKEELSKYFDMPISEACKKLGVGLTVLKKRCRDMDIRRWPHRKLKSMKVLIETVQQLSEKDNGSATRQIGSAIQRLEAERCSIEAAPTLTLTQETRKFRQACFKAKYKMRNLTGRQDSV